MTQPRPANDRVHLGQDSPDRQALIERARHLSPHLSPDDTHVSPIRGGREGADERLSWVDPIAYGRTRNHLDGAVTQLSPFIRHGVVSLAQVRDRVLSSVGSASQAEKMIQQLAWRDYWQRLYAEMGETIWEDCEAYKTGFQRDDYADELPEDILNADTGVAAMDMFIHELVTTGWLHNHARLYLASYICHFRRVKWQAGARFFLKHLLDGDVASNNLSWQWVASTFANKPYYFNLENLQKFSGSHVDTSYHNNKPLAGTYEALHLTLFPNLDPPVPQAAQQTKQKKRRRS
ncbi:MAG: FAD-binding domain-containing protein [Pseudomonadota bacterium]